jgi:hypothetical protein
MTDSVRFAEKFRLDAAAALVQICRDETAPAAARAQAARDILAYSVGRPQAAKQITVADVGRMTDQERGELLHVLLTHYETQMPGSFKAMMVEAYEEAAKRLSAKPPAPAKPTKNYGFRRGDSKLPLTGREPVHGNNAKTRNELEGPPRRIASSSGPRKPMREPRSPLLIHAELPPPRKPSPPAPDNANVVPLIHPRVLERSKLSPQQLIDARAKAWDEPGRWRR